MKHSIFLDTNVVLDIVLEREGYIKDAREILLLRDEEQIELFTSALTVANAVYITRKMGLNHKMVAAKLLRWFSVVDLTGSHLEDASISRFKDFEDGLQYFAAREIKGLDFIVTRDVSGFKESQIPVVSPKEFLAVYKS